MRTLIDLVASDGWAITKNALECILSIADRVAIDPATVHGAMHGKNIEFSSSGNGSSKSGNVNTLNIINGVAVIDITGPIFPRANVFNTMSGATSIESITNDIKEALQNPKVFSMILNIDSPGGAVTGVNELTNFIKASSKAKPVKAYVYGMCASAALWIASGADEIIASETSEVGSVGVVCAFKDDSEKSNRDGIKTIEIVSSISPLKRVNPSTDEGKIKIQRLVDSIASVFVQSLAVNRGMNEDVILKDFGKGDTFLGVKALANGLIDKIGNFQSVLNDSVNNSNIKKGVAMSGQGENTFHAETVQTFTVEGLKESDPKLFDSILEIGAKQERERIQSIETLSSIPGASEIIASNKFNAGITKDAIASLILASHEEKRVKMLAAVEADASALAHTVVPVPAASENETTEAAKNEVKNHIVAGVNSKK